MSYNFIQDSAVISADTEEIKTQVTNEFLEIFGQNINTSDNTVAGLLINAEVEQRISVLENNVNLANQINPNVAGGLFLDAIMGLSQGITSPRIQATSSIINNVVLTGIPTTSIPAGSIAVNETNETEWQTVQDYELDAQGQVLATFESIEKGQIQCPANQLRKIKTGAILGWETVDNPEPAIVGKTTETDSQLRQKRINTLSLQGVGTNGAITSALYNIDNVRSVFYEENFTSNIKDLVLIQLEPKSIYAVVDGGLDQDIADALFFNKSAGCGFNGDVEVIVQDPNTNKNNLIKFDRPEEILLYIRVTIAPTTLSNPEELAKNTLNEYANNNLFIDTDVSIFELASALNIAYPSMQVNNVEISTDNGLTYQASNLQVNFLQVARIPKNNVSLVVV